LPKWIYDIETFTILEVNDAAIDHYGCTKEEFLSKTLSDLRPQSEIPHLLHTQKNSKIREGIMKFGIFTHQKKDGTKIQVEVSGNKLSYQNKACMMVVCIDITDKQKALQQLQQSNQRFNFATKATSDAIWDWDILENKFFWGEGYEIIFGHTNQPVEKHINYWTKYVHPQDKEKLFNNVTVLLKSKDTNWEDEFRYIKADDTYAFVTSKGFVIRDQQGNAIRMVGAMSDITKRKKEDQHRKLLQSVITNTTDAVLITEAEPFDEPGPRIVYVNDAFTKMTGYTEAEVLGKTPRLLQGPKSDKATLKRLSNALRNWESCEITTINYKKNGEAFWINMAISPVADSKGWFTHWIAIERDVTIQKKEELSKLLLKTITELFNKPLDLKQILQQVLGQIANFVEIGMAELWLISNDKKSINLIAYYAENERIKNFYNETTQYNSYTKGQTLSGIIWEKETIQLWANLQELENFMRKDAAKKAGLQSGFGFPIFYNNEVIGVIILASPATQLNTNEFNDLFKTIGDSMGVEIKRKLAEDSIKDSEERMRLIMNAALDAIICTDTKGNVTFWNPQSEAIFGWKEAEVLGKNLTTFIIPEASRFKHDDGMKDYLKTGKNYILNVLIELNAITRTGETIPIELTVIPIKQAEGEFFCAFIRDIKHRKQSEEKLKSERNLLRTLIDNIPDTIYVKDAQARKLISNKVDYKLVGKSTEAEVLGKTDLELFDTHLGHLGYNHDMQILTTGQPIINFEEVFKDQNGKPMWLLTTKVPLLNELNEIIGILGIGRDITGRKVAEEKLIELNKNLEKYIKEIEASNQELEQFAYVASHDLQEPLRMITSFLTQLDKKYSTVLDERGKRYIDFAVDGAKRMRQIILDLLEYSRVGRTESQQEHVNLNVLIDEIKILCSKQINEKKAVITVAHLPTLISYETPLRQVFQNLISNALKYVKPNAASTTINISVQELNNEWQFAIADNGIGINKENFSKIFIIFQRLHSIEEFAGTGMGLAVTKKIIDTMGGCIWVESEEGVGSTFYFTLPKTN
jgi:PAS domain S-box-containing protein